MKKRRENRINSLLKEVISEVILKEVKDPRIPALITVTKVKISKNLKNAKVYISVMEKGKQKKTIDNLNHMAGFISVRASKKVRLRYFPTLSFYLDSSVDNIIKIQEILENLKK